MAISTIALHSNTGFMHHTESKECEQILTSENLVLATLNSEGFFLGPL